MRSVQERLVTEDRVEERLRLGCAQRRGIAIKLYMRGWPDRLVLLRWGRVVFIELKRPVGGKFEPLQERKHKWLRDRGFEVLVLNTHALIDAFFQEHDTRGTK